MGLAPGYRKDQGSPGSRDNEMSHNTSSNVKTEQRRGVFALFEGTCGTLGIDAAF